MPPYDRFDVVSAGHLPPVVVAPGQPAAPVDLKLVPPLGAGSGGRRPPTAVPLPLGGGLVLYTDGLVERRGEALDVGLARLCSVITADSPETVCRTVMHELVGSSNPEDDIAVIAVSRSTT
jgi:serine phosphatase RsbU (regulator of sigma subunit)